MATLNVLVLEGDGPGPEVIAEAVSILRWAAMAGPFSLHVEHARIGGASLEDAGVPITAATLELARQSDAVLLGPVGGPRWSDLEPEQRPERAVRELQDAIGAYCNLRSAAPGRSHPFLASRDVAVVRPLDVIPLDDTRHVYPTVRKAFELARERRGLLARTRSSAARDPVWRAACQELAHRYPEVRVHEDASPGLAELLRTRPDAFDVILTDPRDDAPADAVWTEPGMEPLRPTATFGTRTTIYEPLPSHGRAPGKHDGRSFAALVSAGMLLQHSAHRAGLAREVWRAVDAIASRRAPGPLHAELPAEGLLAHGDTPPWVIGQAVLDRLEATVTPCVSW